MTAESLFDKREDAEQPDSALLQRRDCRPSGRRQVEDSIDACQVADLHGGDHWRSIEHVNARWRKSKGETESTSTWEKYVGTMVALEEQELTLTSQTIGDLSAWPALHVAVQVTIVDGTYRTPWITALGLGVQPSDLLPAGEGWELTATYTDEWLIDDESAAVNIRKWKP